jgi:uncharacterized membrane protein YecN with MAPEG domain
MIYAVLIILLALVQYLYFSMRVGGARGKYGVEAPSTAGNEQFERLFRVQMNTLEQLIVFIPAMLAFAAYALPGWAWVPGLLFLVGRQLYAWEYEKDPASRGPGMGLTFLANAVLVAGALIGVVIKLF